MKYEAHNVIPLPLKRVGNKDDREKGIIRDQNYYKLNLTRGEILIFSSKIFCILKVQ